MSFESFDPVFCSLRGNDATSRYYCSTYNFHNNIGNVQGELYTAFEPIDVVYTWVNGSDPRWREKKEVWAKRAQDHATTTTTSPTSSTSPNTPSTPSNSTDTTVTSNTTTFQHNTIHLSDLNTTLTSDVTTPSNSSSSTNTTLTSPPAEEDDTMSANRYRDSEELRYSLRSLVQHAPWIRHIYVVTDNQVPYWLDVSTPWLSIVPHDVIFANKSHLPVFSSPAIEANLHHIRGLSRRFIYFNDDVMLGSPAVPDDFVTLSGAQRFYMAWDVPKCAPGCSDSWIGDGFCDKACNVSACNFDFPDCINGSNVIGHGANTGGSSHSSSSFTNRANAQCTKGCPSSWLADKICDLRCKTDDCAFDVGDCGLNLIVDSYPGSALSAQNALLSIDDTYFSSFMDLQYYDVSDTNTNANTTSSSLEDVDYDAPVSIPETGSDIIRAALEVPVGTKAVYFNLTYLPCRMLTVNSSCDDIALLNNLTSAAEFKYSSAEHSDDEHVIVHQSTLLAKHHTLVVLLFHGRPDVEEDEDRVPAIPATSFPFVVEFTVVGSDAGGSSVVMVFKLVIVEEDKRVTSLSSHLPSHMNLLSASDIIYSSVTVDAPYRHTSSPSADITESSEANNNTSSEVEERGVEAVALLPLPYRTPVQSRGEGGVEEGVLIDLVLTSLTPPFVSDREKLSVRLTATLTNDTTYTTSFHLCSSVVHLLSTPSSSPQRKKRAVAEERLELTSEAERLCRLNTSDFLDVVSRDYESKYLTSSLRHLLVQQHLLAKKRREEQEQGGAASPLDYDVVPLGRGMAGLFFVPMPLRYEEVGKEVGVHVKVEIFAETDLDQVNERHADVSTAWHRLPSALHTHTHRSDAVRLARAELNLRWGTNTTFSDVTPSANTTIDTTSETTNDNATSTTATSTTTSDTATTTSITTNTSSDTTSTSTSHSSDTTITTADVSSEGFWALEIDAHARNDSNPSNLNLNRRHLTSSFSWYWTDVISLALQQSVEAVRSWLGSGKVRREESSVSRRVNRMYNKVFGVESRKVPAHVPHMIDRDVMAEMQRRWENEWNATSSHRFRSTSDMQYSFSYYYYAINRHKLASVDPTKFLEQYVDHDHDGHVSHNEFRTLVSILKGKQISKHDIEEYSNCVRNTSHLSNPNTTSKSEHLSELTSSLLEFEETKVFDLPSGKLAKTVHFVRYPTIEEVVNCSLVTSALNENKDLIKRLYANQAPIIGSDRDVVAFEMIGDNLTETLNQLDSVRHRQSKFICINDNMKNPSKELEEVLHDFYTSLFPRQSVFELPADRPNPSLYYDEILAIQQERRQHRLYYLLVEDVWQTLRKSQIALLSWLRAELRAWSDVIEDIETRQRSDLSHSPRQKRNEGDRFVQQLRRDVAHNPLADADVTRTTSLLSLNHFHLFLSVAGLALLIALRGRARRQSSGREDEVTSEPPSLQIPRQLPSSTSHIISTETTELEATENKLYAVNKLAADEYVYALRMAAMDEIDSNTLQRDYFQQSTDSFSPYLRDEEVTEEMGEEEEEVEGEDSYVGGSGSGSVGGKKRRKHKKKKKSL